MLTRRYRGDKINPLSESKSRVVNGVFTSGAMRILLQGIVDTVSSSLPSGNQVWLRSRYATFPVCGCIFGFCKRPGNLRRCCHEVCSDSKC